MNTCKNLILFDILFLLLISFFSCKKEEERIMMVRNDSISDISYTSAQAFATIIDPGEGIEQHGHCWSTNTESITIDTENKTENGAKNTSGTYNSILSNLSPSQSYYVRAYVKNGGTVVYGTDIVPFTTLSIGSPIVNTGTVTNITTSSATVSATLNSIGTGASAVTQHGHCWSSGTATPTIDDEKSSLGSRDSTGNYESELIGLSSGTLYYVRAYATNDAKPAYGEALSFSTDQSGSIPSVITAAVSSVTATSAICGGSIISDGGSSITAKGVCWSTDLNPTISGNHTNDGIGSGSFASEITGLVENTTYYVRAYATNSVGTAYGNHVSFTASDEISIPTVTTTAAVDITATTAVSGGNVTFDGGADVTARGVCWNTTGTPTTSDIYTIDGSGTGSFTSNITGLSQGTTYYVRAYATNSAGTAYGNQISFVTTGDDSTVSDYDGNVYTTVQIGEQVWMAENLKTTHYPNGTAIPLVTGNAAWASLVSNNTDDSYCWYYNEEATYKNMYGAIYTWAAAMGDSAESSSAIPSGVQGVCPDGWHLPSDGEWTELENYLTDNGHSGTEGKALKATSGWISDGNGTDDYGFAALPGGYRDYDTGAFYGDEYASSWWSTTEGSSTSALRRYLSYDSDEIFRYFGTKSYGFYVRCVKD